MNLPMLIGMRFYWIETIYSAIVTLFVFLIYLKTREMYKLTEHRGIKYFSYTFLFFTIAHFFKFFFRFFFRFIMENHWLFKPGKVPHLFGNHIFIYTSVMAGLFLLYSLIWKRVKLDEKIVTVLFNAIALFVLILDFIKRNPFVHIGVITGLFGLTLLTSIVKKFKSKKKHSFTFVYLLIFLIWILDLVSIEIPKFMHGFRLIVTAISAILYLVILWRVSKRSSKHGKKTR